MINVCLRCVVWDSLSVCIGVDNEHTEIVDLCHIHTADASEDVFDGSNYAYTYYIYNSLVESALPLHHVCTALLDL